MMLNFWVNQRIFYSLATGDAGPLRKALLDTYERPHGAQWGVFLRAHDELDLGRLTKRQRERVFAAFAPEKRMLLYDRGIRRRLAPMLGNDRRRIELANSLLFTLPGTPVMRYGDEIGMGDDLDLPERYSVRTPMQWSPHRHGGFTTGRRPIRRVIDDPVYGYQQVNVADQRRDPNSLLNWTERIIRTRKECAEIGWGDWKIAAAAARSTSWASATTGTSARRSCCTTSAICPSRSGCEWTTGSSGPAGQPALAGSQRARTRAATTPSSSSRTATAGCASATRNGRSRTKRPAGPDPRPVAIQ